MITGLLITIASVNCSSGTSKNATTTSTVENTTHKAFDKLLKAHVSAEGFVNYAAFAKDKAVLQNYIGSLSKLNPSNWNKNERLAFWINAYNALTIDQIIRHYPISSIQKIANGKVWDESLPYLFAGKRITLNEIEHQILLESDLFDARIHFALNCAAISCPTLANQAFTAENVQSMLTKNTKAALSNPKFNKINKNNAAISKLFDWYQSDFTKAEGSVTNFINKYSAKKIDKNVKITYLDYNWSLNGK